MPAKIQDYYAHLMSRAVRLDNGCLVLPNHLDHPHRYATARLDGKTKKVHRWVYERENGPQEDYILHTCDYPPCFELSHLFHGTQSDNMKDMYNKKREGSDRKVRRGSDAPNWRGGEAHKKLYFRWYDTYKRPNRRNYNPNYSFEQFLKEET